jgi:iron(III) transport system substrate-binding protein
MRTVALLVLACTLLSRAVSAADLAAAQREGVVVWYTSIGLEWLPGLVRRFEASHPGIKVQTLRLAANLLPARIVTEQRSGRYGVDVVNADNVPMAQLEAAGALDPQTQLRDLYFTTTVIAWNPKKLAADGLRPPASLADLAKPEWKGKIGIDATAYNWYQGVLETVPGARELVRAIAANRPYIAAGHDAIVAQLAAGEFDVTPTAYGFLCEAARAAGHPIAWLNPRPMLVDASLVGLGKNAPHPNAARVFLDWLLSKDGQQTIVDLTGRSSRVPGVHNNPRIWDPRAPIHIVGTPDAAAYNALVSEYKTLLGLN